MSTFEKRQCQVQTRDDICEAGDEDHPDPCDRWSSRRTTKSWGATSDDTYEDGGCARRGDSYKDGSPEGPEPVFLFFFCLVFFVVGWLEDEPGRPESE